MKRCTKCGQEKSLTEFYSHKLTKDGYSVWCKECHQENYRKYLKTASGAYTNIKGRVKFYKNKALNITRENFVEWYDNEPKVCVYCDIPAEKLASLNDRVLSRSNRLTIDCIENERGYTMGNLALCCMRCNYIKNDFLSFEEMREIGQKYVKPKWEDQLGCW